VHCDRRWFGLDWAVSRVGIPALRAFETRPTPALLGDERLSPCETGYSARSLYAATRSNSGMISLPQAAFQSRTVPPHLRSTDNLATDLHALAERTGVIRPIGSYLPTATCGLPVMWLIHDVHSGSSLGTSPAHGRLSSESADRVWLPELIQERSEF